MSKAKTLAVTVSTGGVLADGTVDASEVSGLADVATSGSYGDLSNKPTIDSLVPSQDSNSGKFLTTNGTAVAWAPVDALPDQTGNADKYLKTNGTVASWAAVDALPDQTGNANKYLTTDGTTASWADIGSSTPTPTMSGPTSGNEFATISLTITNYNASYAYIVSVTGGSFTRSGATISWTLPAVTANTLHYLTVYAVSGGIWSVALIWNVTVANIPFSGDTGIQITNFNSYSLNDGWA